MIALILQEYVAKSMTIIRGRLLSEIEEDITTAENGFQSRQTYDIKLFNNGISTRFYILYRI